MFEQLDDLTKEYLKKHPDAENPADYLFNFGEKALIQMIKGAGDKEIVFELDPINPDDVDWTYKN